MQMESRFDAPANREFFNEIRQKQTLATASRNVGLSQNSGLDIQFCTRPPKTRSRGEFARAGI
jgi:hypothetical protein